LSLRNGQRPLPLAEMNAMNLRIVPEIWRDWRAREQLVKAHIGFVALR
jgi:hypothetical protein